MFFCEKLCWIFFLLFIAGSRFLASSGGCKLQQYCGMWIRIHIHRIKNLDPDPHQFANDKSRVNFFKGLSLYLEATIWIWIRIRIRVKVGSESTSASNENQDPDTHTDLHQIKISIQIRICIRIKVINRIRIRIRIKVINRIQIRSRIKVMQTRNTGCNSSNRGVFYCIKDYRTSFLVGVQMLLVFLMAESNGLFSPHIVYSGVLLIYEETMFNLCSHFEFECLQAFEIIY
jgi:hypothetical protein